MFAEIANYANDAGMLFHFSVILLLFSARFCGASG